MSLSFVSYYSLSLNTTVLSITCCLWCPILMKLFHGTPLLWLVEDDGPKDPSSQMTLAEFWNNVGTSSCKGCHRSSRSKT